MAPGATGPFSYSRPRGFTQFTFRVPLSLAVSPSPCNRIRLARCSVTVLTGRAKTLLDTRVFQTNGYRFVNEVSVLDVRALDRGVLTSREAPLLLFSLANRSVHGETLARFANLTPRLEEKRRRSLANAATSFPFPAEAERAIRNESTLASGRGSARLPRS